MRATCASIVDLQMYICISLTQPTHQKCSLCHGFVAQAHGVIENAFAGMKALTRIKAEKKTGKNREKCTSGERVVVSITSFSAVRS